MRRVPNDPVFAAEKEAPARTCDHPGCVAGADFRAPRSRLDLEHYRWFCLDHVRVYNSAWNYYAGMTSGEIEAEIRNDIVWQRPTWRLGMRQASGHADPAARMRDPFGFYQDAASGRERGGEKAQRTLSASEQALAVFELDQPFTLVGLKARYKILVKLHHPDAHGGDKAAEEKLKIINQAYATLKAAYFS